MVPISGRLGNSKWNQFYVYVHIHSNYKHTLYTEIEMPDIPGTKEMFVENLIFHQ